MIYVHKKDWYLDLRQRKDSLEMMLDDNEIDISGWELRKALNLLKKSNASMLERIQSPIIYQCDDEFISELRKTSPYFYSKIATLNHYLSMAKKFVYDMESGEEYKLKKFFYTLRSAAICKWIAEKSEVPPIEFSKVYQNLALDPSLVQRINELIALKATVGESYWHKGEKPLMEFIKSCIRQAEDIRNALPTAKGDLEDLNAIFKKYVSRYDH
jgi:predicted nucleotidyltransferase